MIKNLIVSFVLVFDGRCFVRLDSRVSNMFDARMRTTLAQRLVSIVDLCLIKHVLIVWTLTSTLACLVIKQCLKMFGRQSFLVCPGPKSNQFSIFCTFSS